MTVYDEILHELRTIRRLLEERLPPPTVVTIAPRRPGPLPGDRLELRPLTLTDSRGRRVVRQTFSKAKGELS